MIYLDHAAATPLSQAAKTAMIPYLIENFFNPSAPYLPAVELRHTYEEAKNTIAHTIGARGVDLVITSGATESINLAFTSIFDPEQETQVLISAVEHPAVRAAAAKTGHFDTIKVDRTGRILLDDLAAKITPSTQLVSVCLVSSELGTIQPVTEAAQLIAAERSRRLSAGDRTPIYLHCDASQGLDLLDVKVSRLGVDLLTISAAKVYGPKAVGALWYSHNVKLKPQVVGGGQEFGLRSGTENVAGVMGFAAALKDAEKHLATNRKHLASLRENLCKELQANPEIQFLGNPNHQLVNYLPITIPGLDAERLIFKLEQYELYLSTGTACTAKKGEKSPTLAAIGLTDSEIAGSLRITLGKLNTPKQIQPAARTILKVIAEEKARLSSSSGTILAPSLAKSPQTHASHSPTKTVYLGMSGGVDSSVAAVLLKEQGYQVVGCYMKNWSQDLPGMKCPWAEDLADAKRVATMLDIDFKVFDFEQQYRQKVVDYMLAEYQKGHTPNPDIMCNQEIKFKLFYDTAREQGADLIATGHYAKTDGQNLFRAADELKDQTYFLYRISDEALAHTVFPLANLQKTAVKKLAMKHYLPVAKKPESMGVCFVGEAGIHEFLSEFIETSPGQIREVETDQPLGTHDGAIFYTLGQRHGLHLATGLPYYIVKKDMAKNIIYVSQNLNAPDLWADQLDLQDIVIRNAKTGDYQGELYVRTRHRAPLIPATLDGTTLKFAELIRRPATGQSVVFYTGNHQEICLGGGIIASTLVLTLG